MATQTHNSQNLLMLTVGIAVILFSTAGIAAIMGLLPASAGDSSDVHALANPAVVSNEGAGSGQPVTQPAKRKGRSKVRCAECGSIVSIRERESNDESFGTAAVGRMAGDKGLDKPVEFTKSYKIVVRMTDGSIRAIIDASPANWRPGEQVILIAGTNPSSR